MVPEKVLEEIKKILDETGNSDIIRVSDKTNKLADFMSYKKDNEPEMLAESGTPLISFSDISNILYSNNEKDMNYVGSSIKIIFELIDGSVLIYEKGDDKSFWVFVSHNGTVTAKFKDLITTLKNYNLHSAKRNMVELLICSIMPPDYGSYNYDTEEIKIIEEEIWGYILESPNDKDLLFYFAELSLNSFLYYDGDDFVIDLKRIIKYIADIKLREEFLLYIKNSSVGSDGEPFANFVDETALALKLLSEFK